jgi:hypothetical protein
MEGKKSNCGHMRVENLGRQELKVDRPALLELPAELECSAQVFSGGVRQEGRTQQ